ncbi:hypothetical protein CYMTET_53497 [Cymbomonas tetramitiformis]|uniref:Uncharacterized protein n=1 Tax=Cymbomonas tetramitiformis TaxID=36881 RepID=A0AAE0EPN6_9CHLO|nr:hypothetical protein CYMTET_53497 [Cymbomonas tetramitiformis]
MAPLRRCSARKLRKNSVTLDSDSDTGDDESALPDTEAAYYFPALSRFNERTGSAFEGMTVSEDSEKSLPGCSGCHQNNIGWCEGDTYFIDTQADDKQQHSRASNCTAPTLYCVKCMQSKVGVNGEGGLDTGSYEADDSQDSRMMVNDNDIQENIPNHTRVVNATSVTVINSGHILVGMSD